MKRIKRLFVIGTTLGLLAVGGGWFVLNSRAATESPSYEVLETDGDFEIRRYPDLALVSTSTPDREMNGSFMKLFRYIDGGNEGTQKVAMTSPVLMEKGAEQSTMSFILPKAVQDSGAPKPQATDVSVKALPSMEVIAMRFKGRPSPVIEAQATAKIQAWAQAKGKQVQGSVMFAYYDPPWTPSALRRNEVLLRLQPSKADGK
jgi:hypothetical protein